MTLQKEIKTTPIAPQVWLSLDLRKSLDKVPWMGQAEVDHRTSCSSALGDESSLHAQSVSSEGPETCHLWKDLTNGLGRALKGLYRSQKGYLGKVLGAVSGQRRKVAM